MQDKKWLVVLLLAVTGIGANFWGFPVYVLDEAKNAACALEMFDRNDWVTPTFNGQLRTDKPPLHYFFMITSFDLFGVSPWTARLFSIVMGILTVLTVYHFTRRMAGAEAAFWAGMVMVSSLFIGIQFHLAVPDPYFIFFLTWCWLSFAYAWKTGKRAYYYSSYASLAFAFLSKGPAAVVLSAVTVLSFIVLHGAFNWSVLRRIRLPAGILVFITISAPWWVAVGLATKGEWIRGFIWEHNVSRFMAPYEDHLNFPGAVFLLLFVALLPLSGYLPRAVLDSWKAKLNRPLLSISLISVITVLVFFSISRTLLPNYVGPAVPMAAILIGRGIELRLAGYTKSRAIMKWAAVLLAGLISLLVPLMRGAILQDNWISDLPTLAWLFLPISVGAWVAAGFVWFHRLRSAILSIILAFWLTGILLFHFGVPAILEKNPVARSLDMISNAKEEVVAYRYFNAAYVFNLKRTFPTFWDVESLRQYCEGREVLILTRDEDRGALEEAGFRIVFEHPYLFESSVALIVTNAQP